MIRIIAALVALCLAGPAFAQTAPYDLPYTVGTSSVAVLGANPARKRIIFANPNAVAKIAVCGAISRVNSAAIACTVGGAGSIVLLPYDRLVIEGIPAGGGGGAIPGAWNAISDTGGSAFTVIEFE